MALWALLVGSSGFEITVSSFLQLISGSAIIGTLSYLAWQIVALAVRQFLAWREGRSFVPSDQTSRTDARWVWAGPTV